MLVSGRMSRRPITVAPDVPVLDALELMKRERIRRLPVLDKAGHLVGIVSDKDLLHASPSSATSLSVWEITTLIARVTVRDVMTKKVITVTEDTPVEEAARIMADNKIGGLPVMNGSAVAGIITETDLFNLFLELLGGRERGVRVSVLIREAPGQLAAILRAVADAGGNVLALGMSSGTDTSNREVMLKLSDVTRDGLVATLEPLVAQIEDVRET